MAQEKRIISRSEFHDGFPTLRDFFLKTSRMRKEDLQARDQLHAYWRETPPNKQGPRVLWNQRVLEPHISTLAILQRPDFIRAKRFCMAFNGERGCQDPDCKFDHKCLFCGCNDRDSCEVRKGLENERSRYQKTWGQDPFKPSPGLGETDADLQESLRRLAKDAPKKQKKVPASDSSVASTGRFSAFLSDVEDSQAEPSEAADGPQHADESAEAKGAAMSQQPNTEDFPIGKEPTVEEPAADDSALLNEGGAEQGSSAAPAAAPPGLSKQYLLGFVCSLANSQNLDLATCRELFSEEKKVDLKTLAAKALQKSPDELKVCYSERLSVAVLYSYRSPIANELATRFLHAGDPKLQHWLVRGDACFIATKQGTISHVFKMARAEFEEDISADKERFDLWFREEKSKMMKRQDVDIQEGGSGHMLFIPVDGQKMEWFSESPSGYEQIGKLANQIFLSRGSATKRRSCCGDDSSDEEQPERKDVVGCFDQQQLHYSFTKGKHMLAAITCKKEILPPQKKTQLNVRAALILGKLYGLSSLKNTYLKRLRGDAILCMVSPKKELRPRSVWASSELDCDFTKFLESLETSSDGEEEVKAMVMLEEMKTWSFAWLDYGQKYSQTIQKLEEMAQPEDWMMRIDDDDSESGLPYLESYLQFKFAFSLHRSKTTQEECGIGFRKEGQVLIFATGLLRRRDLQPICGVFECNTTRAEDCLLQLPKFECRYKFKKWTTAPEETSTKVDPVDLLTDGCMQSYLQSGTVNELQLHELKSFDPYAVVETPDRSLDHIIRKRERFESDNKQQNLENPLGWDLDYDDRLRDQVQKQLQKVCAWCRTDRSIPIMTVFGDFAYQWLLPLPNPSQEDGKLSENPTLVAVLQCTRKDQKDKPCYILKTVLTLDMALMQARLCGKLHQRWTVSRRQAVELDRLAKAVLTIPTSDPGVKTAVQNVKKCLKEYKECIVRFLPSASSMEDASLPPMRGRRQPKWRRDHGPSSGTSVADSAVSDTEDALAAGSIPTATTPKNIRSTSVAAGADPWMNGKDPWACVSGSTAPPPDSCWGFMVANELQKIRLSRNPKKNGGLSIFHWPAHLREGVVCDFLHALNLQVQGEPGFHKVDEARGEAHVLVTIEGPVDVQQVCDQVEALQRTAKQC